MHLTGWFADRKVTTKLTVLATVLVVVTLAVATTGYQISYAWDASFWGGAKAVDPTTGNRKGFLDIVAGIRTNLAAVHTQYLTGAEKAQLDALRSSAVQKKRNRRPRRRSAIWRSPWPSASSWRSRSPCW